MQRCIKLNKTEKIKAFRNSAMGISGESLSAEMTGSRGCFRISTGSKNVRVKKDIVRPTCLVAKYLLCCLVLNRRCDQSRLSTDEL